MKVKRFIKDTALILVRTLLFIIGIWLFVAAVFYCTKFAFTYLG